MYTVYLHRNVHNNKVYIGITSKKPKYRWKNGLGYSDQSLFWNAIKKYGWESFEHEILRENLTKEEAERLEIELIAKYKSNEREHGYNMADGGDVNRGYHLSENTKRKLSKAHIGKAPWNKGKHGVQEKSGRDKRRVRCIETQEVFESMSEASAKHNVPIGNLCKVCQGKRNMVGGYHWEYVND